VSCWGAGMSGQIGNGALLERTTPTAVDSSGFGAAEHVAIGGRHVCVLAGGSAWCWGLNSASQLGDGTVTNASRPVAVAGVSNLTQLALGSRHSCALDDAGAVWCWGGNWVGQLGDGTTTTRATPVRALVEPAVAIAAGAEFTCAVLTTGEQRCWGSNGFGQLGDGQPLYGSTPRTALVYCP
jgi:alpha-tubulin suppressor-like RCC1 family protein